MESCVISEWKAKYLREIQQIRADNIPVIYMETWYDTHETLKKGWTVGTSK
jgi:hypothetical protein